MTEKIRLLVVDDHKFFRNALILPLYDEPGIEVLAEAVNGVMAKEMVIQLKPDVVLMDLHMPHLDGIQATYQLMQSQNNRDYDLGIVVVTGDNDPGIASKVIKAGARGYLLKDSITDETLLCAIRAATFGGFYCDAHVLQGILKFLSERNSTLTPESIKWQSTLKPEDLQLIYDIASGKENAEIASENQVSPKTISNRLSKLYNTLNVANRVQLVTFSLRHGILSPNDI